MPLETTSAIRSERRTGAPHEPALERGAWERADGSEAGRASQPKPATDVGPARPARIGHTAAPGGAVAGWYDCHGDPAPDVETLVDLANAFGISFWAAMYRSRAAHKLSRKRQTGLTAELRRLEWRLLPRQAFLGDLKDTLTALTPAEVLPRGAYGPPAVLRVPARMRAGALRAPASGRLSLEAAAGLLSLDAESLALELQRAGIE